MRKDALSSFSNHGALSFTAPLRFVLFCLSSVAFRLTTSISLHYVLFCSAPFRFGDRLWAGVLCFRISDTPKQAHLPSLDPAAPFRYSSRHSIALHSSRQPPLHFVSLHATPLHSAISFHETPTLRLHRATSEDSHTCTDKNARPLPPVCAVTRGERMCYVFS